MPIVPLMIKAASLKRQRLLHSIALDWAGAGMLQNGSNNGAFRRLERLVHAVTGMEPRCWSEPSYEWEALDSDASAVPGSSA